MQFDLMKQNIQFQMDLPLKAKVYSGRFLRTGSMPYEELNEIINIPNKEALERIAKTHIGVPVIIEHKELTPDNLKNEIVGRVSRVYINDKGFTDESGKDYPADGWAWCDFTVENQKAIELLDKEGWELSNSYIPVEKLSNNPNYDKEIIAGEGLHLAIVEKGRYNTKVARLNSKPKINNNFLNKPMDIIKKVKDALTGIEKELKVNPTLHNSNFKTSKEKEEEEIKENSYKNKYFMHNDEKISLEEIMNSLVEHKKEAMNNNEASLDDEYDVDGEKMTGHEMLKYYKNIKNGKKNSDIEKEEFEKIQETEKNIEDLESLEIEEQIEKIAKKDNAKSFYKKSTSLNNAKAQFLKNPPKEETENEQIPEFYSSKNSTINKFFK